MAALTNELYLHKKFNINSIEYKHKKFGRCQQQKRKYTYTGDSKMDKMTMDIQVAKRTQTKEIFRPWEMEANGKCRETGLSVQQQQQNIWEYYPNMARTYPSKQRTPKEQERRNRNTLACLINRRTQRIEELTLQKQYTQYREKYTHVLHEQLRSTLYLSCLQLAAPAKSGYTNSMAVTRMQLYQHPFVFGRV